ncbi:MAG: metallophosphoesterase [Caulobacteraceae bacterium]|nr:metallophosphoesterase [Caulobacteraceae bacterium]
MPLFSVLGLSIALHLYIGMRIVPAFPGAVAASLLTLLLVASALFMPLGLLARRLAKPPLADTLAWVGLLFMGLFSSLLVFTVLRDAVLVLAWLANLALGGTLALGGLGAVTAAAVPLLALAVTFLGYLNARRTAGVVTVEIPVANLPTALHGFTIVQISDIHVGPTIRGRYVEAIVEAVNRLKPDVVAITGDLVDGSVAELAGQVAPLARLVSRDGSFFVTGNHEYYSGVDAWMVQLEGLGIQVLQNRHVVIERGGAKLVLAGVADYSAGHFDASHRSDPQAAIAGAPADAAIKVLLAHQPRSAAAAAQAGFDLQLSGHTHGGQFLPWNFLVKLQQPFTAGLHVMDQLRIYVSRGTGYWGPPKRFGAPSEITEVRLVPAV